MALICKSGARECTGCMECYDDAPPYCCPVCGEELDEITTVYIRDGEETGEIIGCELCIAARKARLAFTNYDEFGGDEYGIAL